TDEGVSVATFAVQGRRRPTREMPRNRSPTTLAGRRGAVLVRVSSTQQDTESQITAVKEFLRLHGLAIPEADWYVEQGRSRLERHKSQVLPLFEQTVREGRNNYFLTFSQNRGGYKRDLEFAGLAYFLFGNDAELWGHHHRHPRRPDRPRHLRP